MLEVKNLTKHFVAGEQPVVDDVSFRVRQGEVFVLLGPSGCGKTTTLRIVSGFERADSGQVFVEGRKLEGNGSHIRPEGRGIGFVFQDYALFPHMSVLGNVMYGLKKGSRAARRDRATHLLKLVGLSNFMNRRPHELSGGQQQRVALARTIAPSPKLVLMDEPFCNLDAAMRSTMRSEIRALLTKEGMTTVLVTHDQEEAVSFGDRIAVMHAGRVEQIGPPEAVYRRPRTPFVAQFLGRTNLVQVHADGQFAQTPLGRVKLNRDATGDVVVSMRPEHLRLEAPQPGFPSGEVKTRIYKGHDLTFKVHVNRRTYEVHTDYRCPFVPGDNVRVVPIENAVVVETSVHGHEVRSQEHEDG